MPLEEDADFVGGHELVDGRGPSWPLHSKVQLPILARTTPLPQFGQLNAPAPCSHDVVRKNKFEFGLALFKRAFQPVVLGIAMGHIPHALALARSTKLIVDCNG